MLRRGGEKHKWRGGGKSEVSELISSCPVLISRQLEIQAEIEGVFCLELAAGGTL